MKPPGKKIFHILGRDLVTFLKTKVLLNVKTNIVVPINVITLDHGSNRSYNFKKLN